MQHKYAFKLHPIAFNITLALGVTLTSLNPLYAGQSEEDENNEAVQELELTRIEQVATRSTDITLAPLDMRMSLRSDLSEALSIIPSVRVEDTASSSTRQADLRPAEFSIRGAAPYQNNIRLDNASIDSLLDPAYRVRPGGSPDRTAVEGHSQALFIDPGFLQQLEIIDRNASASEGGFTGGVVKATTRAYQGQNAFGISYRTTGDHWTQFHVDEAELSKFEEGAGQVPTGTPNEFQPTFDKHELSLSGATRIGNIGVFAGFSERRSETVQKRAAELATMTDFDYFLETGHVFKPGEETTLKSHSRYYTLRADLLEVPYDLYATLSYSDFSEDSFLINFADSDFTNDVQGLNLSINYGDTIGNTRVDANLALGQSSNKRNALINTLDNFEGRSAYQFAHIGGFGSLENEQSTLSSSLDFSSPLTSDLNFNYGAEIRYARLKQHRPEDLVDSRHVPLPSPTSRNPVPYEEHLLQRQVTYQAGDIAFNSTNYDAYAELAGDVGSFYYRTGVRVSHDDWLDNTNVAPRLMAGYDFGSEQDFNLEVGANRYYGKSFLSYRLNELARRNIQILERETRGDPESEFIASSGADEWEGSDLDTPYDDEYSVSLTSDRWHGVVGTSFTWREGNKQIRTKRDPESELRSFVNSGQSETQQFDLFWRSPTYQWLNANWRVNSSFSWMDKTTDAQLLNGGYLNAQDPLRDVIFEGDVIPAYELPASDFATPISAQLDVITLALNDQLFVRNAFSFTNGYQFLRNMGRDTESGLESYEVQDQGSTFNWDISAEYALSLGQHAPYVRVDLMNVLNQSNVTRYEQGTQLFTVGRQIWLEVGYRF